MLKRYRIPIVVLLFFLICDAFAWYTTYKVDTAPSLEDIKQAAEVTPTVVVSSVEQSPEGSPEVVSLDGEWSYIQSGSELENYYQPGIDLSAWHTMQLPQNWYLTGLNYQGVMWFRRTIQVESTWQGRSLLLQFEGVDYFADVYLNGELLGRHEGYFQPFSFDISNKVKYGEVNDLVVRVDSPYEPYGTVWPYQKTLIKGIFGHSQIRPGGAWTRAGQEYNTGGIWAPVSLQVGGFVTVENTRLSAAWADSSFATINATVHAHLSLNNRSDEPAFVGLSIELAPRNFTGESFTFAEQKVTLERGINEIDLTTRVTNPHLWWPWDMGSPDLYTATVTVTFNETPVAAGQSVFGFRQVTLSDSFEWSINGVRFFPRGTNYVSNIYLSQTNREWFERDLSLMRQANLNFIRVYAHVEPQDFYATADELGLLVWQDFPLQWGYTDAPAFIDQAKLQLQDMISLLYNHPAIILWCMHNESPWATTAVANRSPNPDNRQNKRMDETLLELAKQLDSTRPAHLNSGTGDAHVYAGWDGGSWKDYASLPGSPFISEYGAQSLPSAAEMQAIFLPEELVYTSGEVRERWEFHDFQHPPSFNIVKLDDQSPISQMVETSQSYQANLLKYATETYRLAKFDPIQGIVQFMFADPWPSLSFSVLDYNRQPKEAFAALATAMQPILPSIQVTLPDSFSNGRWVYPFGYIPSFTFWIVNDTQKNLDVTYTYRLTGTGFQYPIEDTGTLKVTAGEVRVLKSLRDLPIPVGQYTMELTLVDSAGVTLGTNQLSFEILPEPTPTPTPTPKP